MEICSREAVDWFFWRRLHTTYTCQPDSQPQVLGSICQVSQEEDEEDPRWATCPNGVHLHGKTDFALFQQQNLGI